MVRDRTSGHPATSRPTARPPATSRRARPAKKAKAPATAPAKTPASKAKAPAGKAKGTRAAKPTPRGSKLDLVLGMLRNENGVTIADICAETSWLPHTARAWLSKGGAGGKAANIVSKLVEASDGTSCRVYSIS